MPTALQLKNIGSPCRIVQELSRLTVLKLHFKLEKMFVTVMNATM